MFPSCYFAPSYFTPAFWPRPVVVPVTTGTVDFQAFVRVPTPPLADSSELAVNSAWVRAQGLGAGGAGTVTMVSIAAANGFAGTVTDPYSTPLIAVSCAVVGLLKGDGVGISPALPGDDYLDPAGDGSRLRGLMGSQITGSIPGNATNVDGTVPIDHGGTGATDAATARANLGITEEEPFILPFTDADLVAGILTVTHNLGVQFLSVFVYDDGANLIIPDEVTATSTDVVTIDLRSYGTLSGTWHAAVGTGGSSGGGGLTGPIAETDVVGLVADLAAKAPLASPSFTGRIGFDAHDESWQALPAPVDNTITIDWSRGDRWYGTVPATSTYLLFSNVPPIGRSQIILVQFSQPNEGSFDTIIWPPAVLMPPVLTPVAGAVDIISVCIRPDGVSFDAVKSYSSVGGGPAVASIFGRYGDVVAVGGDYRVEQVTGALAASSNLADLTDPAAARTALGLGTILRFERTFDDADLLAGVLAVAHNLGALYPFVAIYDDSDSQVIPSAITAVDPDNLEVDFGGMGQLSGTWKIAVRT